MKRDHSVFFVLGTLALLAGAVRADEPRRNWFDDPFVQATAGLPGCPAPEGPRLTFAQQQRQAHQRAERGTTCWLAGACSEPNAYARDHEINAAAAAALRAQPALASSSVWLTTQRKFVFVQGCARSRAQADAIVATLRRVPQVQYVGDELLIGVRGKPPYRTAEAR